MFPCPLVNLVVISVAFVITVVSPRPPRTQAGDDQELGISHNREKERRNC